MIKWFGIVKEPVPSIYDGPTLYATIVLGEGERRGSMQLMESKHIIMIKWFYHIGPKIEASCESWTLLRDHPELIARLCDLAEANGANTSLGHVIRELRACGFEEEPSQEQEA